MLTTTYMVLKKQLDQRVYYLLLDMLSKLSSKLITSG